MPFKTPFLSIIIPVLNEEKYLPTLLTDLSRQSYNDFEVIVVDGHSDDQTVKKALHFEHRLPKLTVLNSDVRHVCFQRNLGAQHASGKYLLFMDADNQIPDYFLFGVMYRQAQSKVDFFTTYVDSREENLGMQAIDTVINLYIEVSNKTNKPFFLESMFGANREKFLKLKGFKIKTPNEGPELINRALSKKMTVGIFRDPTYTYSMRRIKKRGAFESLSSIAQIQVGNLLGFELSKEKADKLYPMEGGSSYEIDTRNQKILNTLIEKLKLKKHSDKLIKFARSLLYD